MATAGLQDREVKDFRFTLAAKIRITNDDRPLSGRDCLVAVCNKYGLVFVGISNGFHVVRVADVDVTAEKLTSTRPVIEDFQFYMTVLTNEQPRHLAVSSDGSILSVCVCANGRCFVRLYDIQNFSDQTKTPESFFDISFAAGEEVSDLAWNPGQDAASMLALCLADGSLKLVDVKGAGIELLATLPASTRATCFCWSPKGKQIVVGKADGSLVQYDQRFTEKKVIPAVTGLFGGGKDVAVLDVFWESTHVFFAVYRLIDGETSEQPWLVVITLSKDGNSSYNVMEDVCFGAGDTINQKYFLSFVHEWSTLICTSATSAETAVLGRRLQNPNEWERWNLDDTARAEVPMTENYEDAFPKGVGISISSQRQIPLNESVTHPPAPILFLLSSEGLLLCYYMIYTAQSVARFNIKPELLTGNCTRRRQVPSNAAFDLRGQQPPPPAVNSKEPTRAPAAPLAPKPVVPSQAGAHQFPGGGSLLTEQRLLGSVSQQQVITQPFVASMSQAASRPAGSQPQAAPSVSGSQIQFSVAASHQTIGTAQPTAVFQPNVASSAAGIRQLSQPSVRFASGTSSKPALQGIGTSFSSSQVSTAAPAADKTLGQFSTTKLPAASTASVGMPVVGTGFNLGKPLSQSTPASGGPRSVLPDQQTVKSTAQSAAVRMPMVAGFQATALKTIGGGPPISNPAPVVDISAPVRAAAVVPQGVVTGEDNGPQRVSTKRRSTDTAEKLFTNSIEEEIKHFEQELREMRSRSNNTAFVIGSAEEKQMLCRRTCDAAEVHGKIQADFKVLNEQISDLKTRCIELFATTALCEQLKANDGNPAFKDMLRRQPLDPVRERKLKEIRTMNAYIGSEIGKIDCTLDDQWQEYLNGKNGKRVLKAPATDVIYRTLTDNLRIISCQKLALEKLQGALRGLRSCGTQSPWNISDITAADNSLSEQLSRRLNVTDECSITPKSTRVDKDAQLRDALLSRKVTPVISAAPKNLTTSKIVAHRDLKEMLSKSRTENAEALPRNRTNISQHTHTTAVVSNTVQSRPGDAKVGLTNRAHDASATQGMRLKDIQAQAYFTSVIQGHNAAAGQKSVIPSNVPVSSAAGSTKGAFSSSDVPSGKQSANKNLMFSMPQSSERSSVVAVGHQHGTPAALPVRSSTAQEVKRNQVEQRTECEDLNQDEGDEEEEEEYEDQEYEEEDDDDDDDDEDEGEYSDDAGTDYGSRKEGSAAVDPRFDTAAVAAGMLKVPAASSSSANGSTAAPLGRTVTTGEFQMPADPKQIIDSRQVGAIPKGFAKPTQSFSLSLRQSTAAGEPDQNVTSGSTAKMLGGLPANTAAGSLVSGIVTTQPPVTTSSAFAGTGVISKFQSSLSLGPGLFGHKSTSSSGPSSFGFTGNDSLKTAPSSSLTPVFGQASVPASSGTATPLFGQASTVSKTGKEAGMGSAAASSGPTTVSSSASTMLFGKPILASSASGTSASNVIEQSATGTTASVAAATNVVSSAISVPQLAPSVMPAAAKPGPVAVSASDTLVVAASSTAVAGETRPDGGVAVSSTISSANSSGFAPFGSQFAQATVTSSAANVTSAFGLTAVSNTTSEASTGVLAQTPSTTSASSAAFGQSSDTGAAGAGLFGQQAPASSSVFGQPTSSSSVFGQPASTNTASVFGLPATTTTASVFGQPASTSASVFGQPATTTTATVFGQPSSTSTSVFGQPATTTASVFGQPASTSTSVFGQPASTTTASVFGQPASTSTSVFGQPATTTTASVFGQPSSTSTSVFGQPATTTASVFGQPTSTTTASVFGQPASTSTSVFGQPATTTTTSVFGQPASNGTFAFVQPTSSSSVFGQPSESGSAFGQPSAPVSSSSTGFGFGGQSGGFGGQSTFGMPTFGQSSAGSSSSLDGGLFGGGGGGMFGGLGGKPDAAKANSNVFGVSFGSAQQSSGLFGQSPGGSTGFGTVKTQANISGAFSAGGNSVESSGFGGFQKTQPVANQPGQFGSPPAFGSSSAFGSSPAFGGGAMFGGTPLFGSGFGGVASFSSPTGGSKPFGSGDGTSNASFGGGSATFAALAQTNTPTFGSLAQQQTGGGFGAQQQTGGGFGAQQPTFGGFGFGAGSGGGAQSPFGGGASFSTPQSPSSSFTAYR